MSKRSTDAGKTVAAYEAIKGECWYGPEWRRANPTRGVPSHHLCAKDRHVDDAPTIYVEADKAAAEADDDADANVASDLVDDEEVVD